MVRVSASSPKTVFKSSYVSVVVFPSLKQKISHRRAVLHLVFLKIAGVKNLELQKSNKMIFYTKQNGKKLITEYVTISYYYFPPLFIKYRQT